MIVAHNQQQEPVTGVEVESSDGPFFCPECQEQVHLKKGIVRMPHFAHFPASTCTYGKGESDSHLYCKWQMYLALKQRPECSQVQLEAKIGARRADILAVIRDVKVAIEIQRSDETIEGIRQKLADYFQEGTACIYIDPGSAPSVNVSVQAWRRYLHAMWFGELYYWADADKVYPVHIGIYRYIPEVTWNEDLYLQPRTAYRYIIPLSLCEFGVRHHAERDMSYRHIGITDSLIWRSNNGAWWTDPDSISGRFASEMQPIRVDSRTWRLSGEAASFGRRTHHSR